MSRGAGFAGVAAAVLTVAALTTISRRPIEIAVGGAAWGRIVRGPTADGILYPGARATIAFPDLPRARPREVLIDGVSLGDSPSVLSVSVDGAAPVLVALDARRAGRVTLPSAGHTGLRLDLAAERGAPPARLRAVTVGGAWPSPFVMVLALLACLATWGAARVEVLETPAAIVLAPVTASAAVLGVALATGTLSVGWSGAAITAAVTLLAAAIVAGARLSRPSRAGLARAALLVGALAFGTAARWIFAPSQGSWDTDYWRAWTESAIAHGVTGAYGPPLTPGAFVPTLRGHEPLWTVTHDGRRFTIDYPPLALAAWRAAAALIEPTDAPSWNVTLKLPALAGDLLSVVVLLFWWPGRRTGARVAALYWALPASWLSSAALGYLDGAYAPFVLVAAVAAGSGRAGLAGAALAVAALLKPTALVAAPAIAVALLVPRQILTAIAAGLGVAALAIVPLALAGTLGTAIAHVVSILYQERLSGGYANAWWLLGAAVWGRITSVPYVRIDIVPFPVRAVGVIAFAAAAFVIGRALARARGTAATVAATAALFAAYGVLGVGVHVNHPHPMVLLFLAASSAAVWRQQNYAARVDRAAQNKESLRLGKRRDAPRLAGAAWRWPAWIFIHGYALNILLLEQLGRLAGPRYGPLEAAGSLIDRIRLGAGFDLTLALAVAHVTALGMLLARAVPALEHFASDGRQVDDPTAVDKLDERVKYGLQ